MGDAVENLRRCPRDPDRGHSDRRHSLRAPLRRPRSRGGTRRPSLPRRGDTGQEQFRSSVGRRSRVPGSCAARPRRGRQHPPSTRSLVRSRSSGFPLADSARGHSFRASAPRLRRSGAARWPKSRHPPPLVSFSTRPLRSAPWAPCEALLSFEETEMIFPARSSFPGPPIAVRQSRKDSGGSAVVVAILLAVTAGVVIALVALLGGGKETVASRSAAAFEEAQRKGIPVGEAAHGHGAVAPGAAHGGDSEPEKPEAGHAAHGEVEMPDHGGEMPAHGGHAMTGTTAGGVSPHAGMPHGTSAPGSGAAPSSHAGMQHGSPAPRPGASRPTTGPAGHAGHGGIPPAPAEATASAPTEPLAKSAVARPGQPAATLRSDPLDSPAATSEMDAKRAAEMAASMGSGGHGTHGTGSYVQIDAGRESVGKAEPTSPGHEGMGHGSMPPPAPTATPDSRKPRPRRTPVPTPSGHAHPGGGDR